MTIKTLAPVWVVASRGKSRRYIDQVCMTRSIARILVRQWNKETAARPMGRRLPKYYVARFIHVHEGHADFTR